MAQQWLSKLKSVSFWLWVLLGLSVVQEFYLRNITDARLWIDVVGTVTNWADLIAVQALANLNATGLLFRIWSLGYGYRRILALLVATVLFKVTLVFVVGLAMALITAFLASADVEHSSFASFAWQQAVLRMPHQFFLSVFISVWGIWLALLTRGRYTLLFYLAFIFSHLLFGSLFKMLFGPELGGKLAVYLPTGLEGLLYREPDNLFYQALCVAELLAALGLAYVCMPAIRSVRR